MEAAYTLLFVLNPITIALAIYLTPKGATMSDVQAAVDAITATLVKAKAELVAKIDQLEADLLAGRQPDLDALRNAAQALDDLTPDAPAAEAPADNAPLDGTV